MKNNPTAPSGHVGSSDLLVDSLAEPIGLAMGRQGQPIDEETGRFACSKDWPMPEVHAGQWIHRDAVDDGRNDPYYDHYRCPHCGERFSCEVAE